MPPVHDEQRRAPRRSVLLIGSEAQPFAKTGGLADVLGALPPALQRLGWDATVALPRYRGVSAGALVDTFPVTVGGYTRDVGFFEAPLADGARAVLVDCPDLYDRAGLYAVDNTDYPDNARRFAFLVRAALEYAARRGAGPSIVHAHDWQAGLAPVYLRDALRVASRARRHAERLHDPQPRVPGTLRARLAAASRSRLGSVRDRSARVLRPHQLSQGRHQRRAT